MEPSLFPSPPPSPFASQFSNTNYEKHQSTWKTYWSFLYWYITQGGRVAVSLGISSLIWIIFSVLPGLLAWILTIVILILVGQYDIKIKHTKNN